MLSVALIGLGDIGQKAHLPAMLRSPDIAVTAVADPVAERRDAVRSLITPRTLVASRLDEVLKTDADGIVLATPPWATPELAVRALQAGRFVLAEKPVAASVRAGAEYDQLTTDQQRRLQVGLTYRHDPAIARLKSWIGDGVLGSPLLIRAHIYDERRDPSDAEHLERMSRTLGHGTPVVHEGAHVFDWITHMLGPGELSVDDAWALRTDAHLPASNLTGARLTHPNGHCALVEFGWLTDELPPCKITVLGQRGLAVLDVASFRLRLSTATGVEIIESPGDRAARCFDAQLTRFVQLIKGERAKPEPDLADGLAALAIADRVVSAATDGIPA